MDKKLNKKNLKNYELTCDMSLTPYAANTNDLIALIFKKLKLN